LVQTVFTPLLNWDNESRASKAWSGCLSHGGWTNAPLSDRFLGMLLSTATHGDQLNKQGRRALTRLFASIAMSADADPDTWIKDLITNSSVPDRLAWARAIRFQFHSLHSQLVEDQWDRWIGEYLNDRVSGVPRNLCTAEASAVAGWLVFLTDSMASAIELLLPTETAWFKPSRSIPSRHRQEANRNSTRDERPTAPPSAEVNGRRVLPGVGNRRPSRTPEVSRRGR
jgi:hypothetical protein